MHLFQYAVNPDGQLTCNTVPVISTFHDKETNTTEYLTEKGKVVEFYDFDSPGPCVWTKTKNDAKAKTLIRTFYEGVLKEQSKAASRTRALVKMLA